MSIRNDYHIHSEISPDGKSDMEHMCQSAIEKKIQEIVFTDHYECYAYGVRSKYFDSEYVRTYFEHIEKVQKKYQGILNVKSGIELGQSYLNPSEAKNGEYDCIGHLDYYKKHCARARLSDQFEYYRPIIKKILKYIIERGKGIEVNTACMGMLMEETMPDLPILELYRELGGSIITVGSDAHTPDRVGYGFEQVRKKLLKAGFTQITVYEKRVPRQIDLAEMTK